MKSMNPNSENYEIQSHVSKFCFIFEDITGGVGPARECRMGREIGGEEQQRNSTAGAIIGDYR